MKWLAMLVSIGIGGTNADSSMPDDYEAFLGRIQVQACPDVSCVCKALVEHLEERFEVRIGRRVPRECPTFFYGMPVTDCGDGKRFVCFDEKMVPWCFITDQQKVGGTYGRTMVFVKYVPDGNCTGSGRFEKEKEYLLRSSYSVKCGVSDRTVAWLRGQTIVWYEQDSRRKVRLLNRTGAVLFERTLEDHIRDGEYLVHLDVSPSGKEFVMRLCKRTYTECFQKRWVFIDFEKGELASVSRDFTGSEIVGEGRYVLLIDRGPKEGVGDKFFIDYEVYDFQGELLRTARVDPIEMNKQQDDEWDFQYHGYPKDITDGLP